MVGRLFIIRSIHLVTCFKLSSMWSYVHKWWNIHCSVGWIRNMVFCFVRCDYSCPISSHLSFIDHGLSSCFVKQQRLGIKKQQFIYAKVLAFCLVLSYNSIAFGFLSFCLLFQAWLAWCFFFFCYSVFFSNSCVFFWYPFLLVFLVPFGLWCFTSIKSFGFSKKKILTLTFNICPSKKKESLT